MVTAHYVVDIFVLYCTSWKLKSHAQREWNIYQADFYSEAVFIGLNIWLKWTTTRRWVKISLRILNLSHLRSWGFYRMGRWIWVPYVKAVYAKYPIVLKMWRSKLPLKCLFRNSAGVVGDTLKATCSCVICIGTFVSRYVMTIRILWTLCSHIQKLSPQAPENTVVR